MDQNYAEEMRHDEASLSRAETALAAGFSRRSERPTPYSRLRLIFTMPFDDVLGPFVQIDRLFQHFKILQIGQVPVEIHNFMKTNGLDSDLLPYFNGKFILKVIARLFPYWPPSRASQ
jgi:hypothetical protein